MSTTSVQNKQKARQARKKEGWYKSQFSTTLANKLRQFKARNRRRVRWGREQLPCTVKTVTA